VICPTGRAKYFCRQGWTETKPADGVICPSGRSADAWECVGWVERFAKPITVRNMMGIASLNPSYLTRHCKERSDATIKPVNQC
jgi:hypothetical protein